MGGRGGGQGGVQGEVAGAFLLGLVESFRNLQLHPEVEWILCPGGVDPKDWYPYSLLIDILHRLEQAIPSSNTLFFRAGMNFLRLWYENGPGKAMIRSSLDWLYANRDGGGYKTVVRGGDRDEIGWCALRSLDEQAGIAVYDNVTPLVPEYVRGVFYGGCVLFDDLDYVDVQVEPKPYEGNTAFHWIVVTVRFRLKQAEAADSLDARLAGLGPGTTPALNPQEVESLAWRHKGLLVRMGLDSAYYNDLNDLLVQSIGIIQAQRDEIEHLSYHDPLTGLPNLRLARDRMNMACNHARRTRSRVALLFIDLDGFKAVNDSSGHEAGDHVLKTVAQRLGEGIRASDTAARQGGDEFLVILNDVTDERAALQVAEALLTAIGQPMPSKNGPIRIGASIGIGFYPEPASSAEELLTMADKAMYAAKNAGKNKVVLYCP